MDSAGNLFGTTSAAGVYGCGMAFELRNKTWKYIDIHDFESKPTDGCYSDSGPTLDSVGNLYGSTYAGGTSNDGVVYKIPQRGKKF